MSDQTPTLRWCFAHSKQAGPKSAVCVIGQRNLLSALEKGNDHTKIKPCDIYMMVPADDTLWRLNMGNAVIGKDGDDAAVERLIGMGVLNQVYPKEET